MKRPLAALEVETFARTAVRFAAKRRALGIEAVGTLSVDIVRSLASRAVEEGPDGVLPEELEAFRTTLLEPDPDAAVRFFADRRAEGVTRQNIYLGYISAAARLLGDDWDNNRLSLTEVSIATGHLYALMRAMRADGGHGSQSFDIRKCALFAAVPGEDHNLGITVAAGLFRDAGWEVDLQVGLDHAGLVARAEATQPRVIGLSLSTEARLPALARLVVALRLSLPRIILGVAPAARLDAATLEHLLDIDLVLQDASTARADLERLVAARG